MLVYLFYISMKGKSAMLLIANRETVMACVPAKLFITARWLDIYIIFEPSQSTTIELFYNIPDTLGGFHDNMVYLKIL